MSARECSHVNSVRRYPPRRTPMSRSTLCSIAIAALLTSVTLTGAAWAQTPWVAPEAEKAKKNPLPADKKAIEQGAKVAKTNCVSCHVESGKGDGAAAAALNPKPAD